MFIFLVIYLNLKSFYNSSIIFFNLLYGWTLFLKIKNNYFMIIFLICAVLHDVFIPYILFDQFNFVKISIIVCLNKKIILIKKI